MVKSFIQNARSQAEIILKDKRTWILFVIVALGTYLRSVNIEHTFNAVHDYDEGAYSLAARFITEGYWPYQDFNFAHPPLYELLLAGVYKIFGYSFFYGRYLSVALAIISIVLIYLVGKKIYSPKVGLVASALFAVSPDMVYFGRRVVQESLGIFLLLAAVYFAVNYIQTKKGKQALLCGLFLGLTVATKFIFIPAVVAVILATAIISARKEIWQKVKEFSRPSFWITYLSLAALAYSIILLLRWSFELDIAVPFIDPLYLSLGNLAIIFFVLLLPLIVTMIIMTNARSIKQWLIGIWSVHRNRGLWLLFGGTFLGFLAVTAVFLIKAPQEFIYQSVIMQQNRSMVEFPSMVGFVRGALLIPTFLRLSFIPVLLTIPVILIILNKAKFSKYDCFLVMALITSLVMCQAFPSLPRYYASTYIFLFLGIAQLISPLSLESLKTRFRSLTAAIKVRAVSLLAVIALFLTVSLLLITNYTGYDIAWAVFQSNEEYVYNKTVDYLESAEAKKVYSTNPSVLAMSSELESTLAFDTYYLLWLEEKPPDEIVDNLLDEGVDYIVVESWARVWNFPYLDEVESLVKEIRQRSRLMTVIAPGTSNRAEIYLLGAGQGGIFNGSFQQWVIGEETNLPLGWDLRTVTGEGDQVDVNQVSIEGSDCLEVSLTEDGIRDGDLDYSFASVYQRDVPFPDSSITITVLPQSSTMKSGSDVLGPGIHLVDRDNHALIIGFSDEVEEDTSYIYEDGDTMLLIKKVSLGEWYELDIDLASYWQQAGWLLPQEINVYLAVAASYNSPGNHAFYISDVKWGQ